MQFLYNEFVEVLPKQFPKAFTALPEDLHSAVFHCLAGYQHHCPSTKWDFDMGKELEIDSLNGYLQRCAQRLGIPTPHNDRLVAEVRRMVEERKAHN